MGRTGTNSFRTNEIARLEPIFSYHLESELLKRLNNSRIMVLFPDYIKVQIENNIGIWTYKIDDGFMKVKGGMTAAWLADKIVAEYRKCVEKYFFRHL